MNGYHKQSPMTVGVDLLIMLLQLLGCFWFSSVNSSFAATY